MQYSLRTHRRSHRWAWRLVRPLNHCFPTSAGFSSTCWSPGVACSDSPASPCLVVLSVFGGNTGWDSVVLATLATSSAVGCSSSGERFRTGVATGGSCDVSCNSKCDINKLGTVTHAYIYAVYITDNICMLEVFYSLRAPVSCQAPRAVLQLKPGNGICFFPSQMLSVS